MTQIHENELFTTSCTNSNECFNNNLSKHDIVEGPNSLRYQLQNKDCEKSNSSFPICIALNFNRKKKVGMAIMNPNSSVVVLSEYVDTANFSVTRNMIDVYLPGRIVLPKSSKKTTSFLEIIHGDFSKAYPNLISISKSLWCEQKGFSLLYSLADSSSLVVVSNELQDKYLCLSSLCALLSHIEDVQQIAFVPSSLIVRYRSAEGFLLLDSVTIRNLELLHCIEVPFVDKGLDKGHTQKKQSVLSYIDKTITPMGERMLRMNLLQPFTDVNTIQHRQKALDEILQHEDEFFECKSLLRKFAFDMDSIISTFSTEKKVVDANSAAKIISNIIAVKLCLESLEDIIMILSSFSSPLLQSIRETFQCDSREILLAHVKEIIDPNVTLSKSKDINQCNTCFALKNGVDEFLDTTREIYTELHEDIYELLENLKLETGLHSLKILHSSKRGFYLSLDISEIIPEKYSSMFIQVYNFKKRTTFSTLELNSLNTRLREVTDDILQLTVKALQPLVELIRSNIGWLVSVSESIAILDVIFSFSSIMCSSRVGVKGASIWSIPQFSDDGPIAIKRGRHPLLMTSIGESFVIPNDFYLSSTHNFAVISGANQSGKSTLLKTIAIVQILSQIGGPAPVEYATLRYIKQIFTRIGCDDSQESNASSFMVEMREMANIIQNARPSSLILIDELGRSTSNLDATAISFSISEYLLSQDVFTCFVTHIPQITELENMYPNVKNLHMVVKVPKESDKIKFMYELCNGPCDIDGYGLRLARVMRLPSIVLDEATNTYEKLKKEKNLITIPKDTIVRKLAGRIIQLCKTGGPENHQWKRTMLDLQEKIQGVLHEIAKR